MKASLKKELALQFLRRMIGLTTTIERRGYTMYTKARTDRRRLRDILRDLE